MEKIEEKEKLIKLALNAEKQEQSNMLECVIEDTAKEITFKLNIPTIGIGSSKYCDGQVLVFDDIVKFDNTNKAPKFVKRYKFRDNLLKRLLKILIKT